MSSCSSRQPADPNIVTIAVRVGPNTLDPRQGADEGSQRIYQLVFNSLFNIGPDLRIKPLLAHRLDNPDPLTYVAHLRRGVKFHDGHELTSRDVVYTYEAFLDPTYVSPFKGAFRMLESVKALDDYTVEFRLKEPFGAFPVQLAGVPPIVPADSGDSLRSFPIGTGPYRFVSYAVDDQLVLSAFEGYWDGLPNNAGLIVKVIPDDTMRGLELRKGSVDLAVNDIPPDIVHQLERDDHLQVRRTAGLDFSYLGFNLKDPILANRKVRHAIGFAIDRQAIVDHLRRGLARPAFGLVPPQAWAFEPDVFTFSHDPERAKRLLDEAGYPDPDGDGPLSRLQISLKTSTNEEFRIQGTVIQQDLRRVGIDLDLRSYEFATFFADVLKGNFQISQLIWAGGSMVDPDILRRVYHSQQVPPSGFNRGRYHNPAVDRLIEQATTVLNEEERRKYYSEAQKLIAEDAPYIPLWNRTNVMVASAGLTGLHLDPTGDLLALKDVKRVTPP